VAGTPAGDTLDFEQIYRDHFAFVWRTLRRLGVRESALDDAAQEVFLVVHRRLDDFDGRVALRSWLFGVAHRTALAQRRTARKADAEPLPTELRARAGTPHDRAVASEAVEFLDAFLDTLGDQQRSVFILVELEQMSVPEIAAALGVKLNTVYSRLRLARGAFRRAVERRNRGDQVPTDATKGHDDG
jgi:RNA polymerase sigma-70 factor (ECF subfamily)